MFWPYMGTATFCWLIRFNTCTRREIEMAEKQVHLWFTLSNVWFCNADTFHNYGMVIHFFATFDFFSPWVHYDHYYRYRYRHHHYHCIIIIIIIIIIITIILITFKYRRYHFLAPRSVYKGLTDHFFILLLVTEFLNAQVHNSSVSFFKSRNSNRLY